MLLWIIALLILALNCEVCSATTVPSTEVPTDVPTKVPTEVPIVPTEVPTIVPTEVPPENETTVPLTNIPITPVTPVPDVEGSSPLKWMGIAINAAVIAGLLLSSCWLARSSKTKPGGGLCISFSMLLPPRTCEELSRLVTSDLRNITPTASENIILDLRSANQKHHLRQLPKAMLCWRRTQLSTALLFYAGSLGLAAANVYMAGSFSTIVTGSDSLSDDTILRGHFRDQIFDIIPFSQAILGLSFYSFAAYRWHDLNQSRFLAISGFCVTFLMPFAFFMVPWMEIDSPQRKVQDMCKSLADSGVPIFTISGIALKYTNICSKTAHEIGYDFAHDLLLRVDNGGYALSLIGTILKLLVYVPTIISSFTVMKSLAPNVLGILMGLQSGLMISKITFPGARLTTWLLVMMQAAALPVTMFLCAIILIVVGTLPTMFTAIFMTVSTSLYIAFHGRLLRANRLKDAISLVGKLNRASLVLKILAVGFLVFGVLKAAQIMALKAEGVKVIQNALRGQVITRMAISYLAGFFSSKVVFTDIVLHMIMGTYVACTQDPQEDRNEVMKDLLYLSAALNEYEDEFDLQAIEDGHLDDFADLGQLTIASPVHHLRKRIELATVPNECSVTEIDAPMLIQ